MSEKKIGKTFLKKIVSEKKDRNLRQRHDDLEQIRIAHAIKKTKVFKFFIHSLQKQNN
jgi:hypothetical protein